MAAYKVPAGTNPLSIYRGSPDNIYVPTDFRTGFTNAWQEKYGKPPQETDIRAGFLKASKASIPAPIAQPVNSGEFENGYD